jgi:endoglucanase
MIGVNLSGGEFGSTIGKYGRDYIYPTQKSLKYYADKGMDVVRVPFDWLRVQTKEGGALNQAELARLDAVVDNAKALGLKVVLDLHGYGSGYGKLIGSGTPNASFADFWGKLAGHFKVDSNVFFGLMNEPHTQKASQWIGSVNAAVDAIRDAGAKQKILVPGTYWDGAHSWVSSDNDTVIGNGVKDPLDNYAFEVHQYLDSDSSGTHKNVVSETVGVERLKAITAWAKTTGHELFMGEFGVSTDSTSLKALNNMLSYMDKNSDVWIGATYWAGGPWWGDYMYSVEPKNGIDKPQMAILQKYDLESSSESVRGSAPDALSGDAPAPHTFIFDSPSNPPVVKNFIVGEDTMQLDRSVFTALPKTGSLWAQTFYKGLEAHDSSDRIIYDSTTGVLSYDADGNGSAEAIMIAQLTKGLALTRDDFLVI